MSDTVYEVFSCPVWEYRVKITVRLMLQKENSQQSFELKPGIPVEWKNLKIALPSVSKPPVPILGSQFLTDGVKTVMVRASASDQPVSGTVGEIQCASHEKALKFDCYLPHDSCTCQPRENQVSCNCADKTLEDLFHKIEYVLPMTSQGISISGIGNSIQAEYHKIASLELQITLEGFRLATKVDKNKCEIKPLEFGGCYSCFTGAKLRFECKTNFGEALAHSICGTASFSTTCTPQGLTAIATMNFPHASVKETCTVNCPAGFSIFQLEATLVFIEKERLENITNLISTKNEGGGIDFGFLPGWLSGNWLTGILIIAGALVLIILTLLIFPTLIQCVITVAYKAGTKIRQRYTNKYTDYFKQKQH